jgi:hypothetical protein
VLEFELDQLPPLAQALGVPFILYVLGRCSKNLKDMSTSIQQLNEKVAVIIEKIASHEKAIDDHGERIRDLERGRTIQ